MNGPSAIDVSTAGSVRPESASAGPERFTASSVTSNTSLADSLTRLAKSVTDCVGLLTGWRRASAITFENVSCSTGGAKIRLNHGLNRRVRWCVVGWRGASTTVAPGLVSDEIDFNATSTPNMLALRSYVAGTADIEVY